MLDLTVSSTLQIGIVSLDLPLQMFCSVTSLPKSQLFGRQRGKVWIDGSRSNLLCNSQSEIKVCDVVWASLNWVWFICHGEKLSVFAILTMMTLWVGNGGLQRAFWETSCCFIPDNGALYCISYYCLGSFLNILGHCDVVVTYCCSKDDPLNGFKWMIVLRSKDHLFFRDGCSCEQLHQLCRIKKIKNKKQMND